MSCTSGSQKSVKCVQKLSKPRPLKLGSSGDSENIPPLVSPVSLTYANVDNINEDDVLRELENLHVTISNGNFDQSTTALVNRVCHLLKLRGAHIDSEHKDQLDVYMVTLRSASRDDRLDITCRTRLLEVLEMRSLKWRPTEDVMEFYGKKLEPSESVSALPQQVSGMMHPGPLLQQPLAPMQPNAGAPGPPLLIPQYIPLTQFPLGAALAPQAALPMQAPVQPPLMPGEVLRSSGKFGKPAKIPGRNFMKDEVVIRNADSGKVMGIKGRRVHMIEELSDTVISFQRVNPGARDRLVQITGPTEESIHQAKQLIEETIRRNASPVRVCSYRPLPRLRLEPSSQDDSSGSYDNSTATSPSGAHPPTHMSPPDQRPHQTPVTTNPHQTVHPNSTHPLAHSLSTGDAAQDRDFTYMVQGIKISAPKQQLALTAKVVLERHFTQTAQALLQSGITEPNFIRIGALPPNFSVLPPNYTYPPPPPHDNWSTTTSSSSDEDTYRNDKKGQNGRRGTSPGDTSGPRESKREKENTTKESNGGGKDTNAGKNNNGGRNHSRDELLNLANSEDSKRAPEDLDALDPDFAVVIMRQDLTSFDVEAFRKWMPHPSGLRHSPNNRRSPSNDSES